MPRTNHTRKLTLTNKLAALEQRLGPIEYRALSSLKKYENNPRKHPEKQLAKLACSIQEFGFAMPMLVDEGGTIIAGEARFEAARRVGLIEVPVIVAHHWSPAQVKAYRLADNRLAELGKWDDKLLALELEAIIEFDESPIEILGWETGEIDVLLDEADVVTGEGEGDPADEPVAHPSAPVTRAGDLWKLGHHRLLCGSSLEAASWATLLCGETAAMAFTDPPYNVKVSGHTCGLGKASHDEFAMASGEMSKSELTTFLAGFTAVMLPYLKDGAVLDICMDHRHFGELLSAIEANELSLLNLCVWNKSTGGMGSLYRSKHELVFIAKKGEAPHTNNVELGKDGRYRTNVWDYAGVNSLCRTRMEDLADHPTVKPVALVADAIRDVTHPGEIVLDAFMGSGTTALAAERTKRRAYGIEIVPGYIDVAIRRWMAMTGEEAVLASTGQSFDEIGSERAAEPPADDAASAPAATDATA
ncbi:site-specific DNA-methyltransferase [Erythrobacter sp.]|uniref:site-specific DNA-methyltransferase n=1 Tax=Erythrobacter sp. TaxID=1042 RepID=UPI003C76E32B